MNNLKIVYKKPTEYDNSTISVSYTDSSTNSDLSTNTDISKEYDNKELNNNIGVIGNLHHNLIESSENKMLNTMFSDDEIDNLVFVLKKNIMSLSEKNQIIKYIDNFFQVNNLNEEVKNKILLKLNESIDTILKTNDQKQKINSDIILNKTDENSSNPKKSLNNLNSNSKKILGLDIGLWGIICIIIILLFLYMRKRN